jgi:hypothetical protein
MKKARWFKVGAVALLLVGIGVGAFWWMKRPKMPPVSDAASGMKFMASDDFNKLTESQRLAYAMQVVDRMRGLPYDEYLHLMLRPDDLRMRLAENMRRVPGHEKFGSALFALFLDRFWEQNPGKRTGTLMIIALAQQGQFGKHPERYGLPSADEIKTEMNKFVTRQPVKTQAQCAQFMVELKRQREFMGLKEPF